MKDFEASRLAQRLRQLLPTMNDEQQETAARRMTPYDANMVFEAIEEHASSNKFFNLADLMLKITSTCRKDPALAEAIRESDLRSAAARRASLEQHDAEWVEIEKLIAEFSDEDLEMLKNHVIDHATVDGMPLSIAGKEYLRTRAVRSSRALKSNIFEYVRMRGEVPS